MPSKTRDGQSIRADVDVRPGYNQSTDRRNLGSPADSAGAHGYPGKPPSAQAERFNSGQENTSIRSVRVGDLGPGFGSGPLGAMELAGRSVSVPKIPPMQKFASRPISGPGPIEQQTLAQQQANSIAMGDPDYAPLRELDYESIKDANFTAGQKSASRSDKDFTK